MKNKFERALINYGGQIMTAIYQYTLKSERYEDCAVIKTFFEKYNLDLNQTVEDCQSYFWELGLSGRTAATNLNLYLEEALAMIGYPADAISIDNNIPL